MIPISDANRSRSFPFVNLAIIALNIVVYLYEVMVSASRGNGTLVSCINLCEDRPLARFFADWAVIPYEFAHQGIDVVWNNQQGYIPVAQSPPHAIFLNLLTSMFMHGGLVHIGGNMLFLWVFGDNVEDNMGHIKYALFYLIVGLAAGLTHIVVTNLAHLEALAPSLGASGAIAGVLAAYLVLYPRARVRSLIFLGYFIIFRYISAIWLIGLWFALQLFDGLAGLGATTAQTSGVAVWAHIGGFIAGALLVFLFRGRTAQLTGGQYPAGGGRF